MKNIIWQKFILGCGNLKTPLENGLGGVIFFSKDIQSKEQFKTLIREIKNSALIPPFLSIDQEGGRVERTESIRPKRLSARDAYKKGPLFLQTQSEEISKELAEYGVNLNFAPCIDVNTNLQNPIIGERAFSDNPSDVIKGMQIFIEASKKYGIIPCVKHFPGHGDADKDSHLTLPQINLSLQKMEKTHIKPFQQAIEDGIEMIMAAHLHCTCFDQKIIPSSLSKNVLSYLRKDLNYNGVIISDDMVMKGVEKFGKLEAIIMGIEAGLDMFIFRDSDNETIEAINRLCEIVEADEELKKQVLISNERIKTLKEKWL